MFIIVVGILNLNITRGETWRDYNAAENKLLSSSSAVILVRVMVLEAASRLGGRVHTLQVGSLHSSNSFILYEVFIFLLVVCKDYATKRHYYH